MVRIGVAGAVVTFLAIGTLHLLAVPPFVPVDETSHTGYALALTDGRLPTIHDMVDSERIRGMSPDTDVWTANHAPAYYGLVSVPLAAGEAAGAPLGGFYAARALTLLLGGAAVAGVVWVASLLVPGRLDIAVGAGAIAALVPAFPHISAFVHNDALAILTSTGVLGVGVLVLRRGVTRDRLAALAAFAAAAALVRASGLAAAAVGVGAVGLAVLLHDGSRPLTRVGRALAAPGLVMVAVLASSGWFYLRNLRLYGDITGATALLERFERSPSLPVSERLLTPEFWVDQQFQLWGRLAGRFFLDGPLVIAAHALAVVVVVGLVVAMVRRGVALVRGPRALDLGGACAWLLALGWLAMLVVMIAGFGARGGGLHARYLLPGVAVLGLLAATGMAALPGGRRGLPLIVFLLTHAFVSVAVLVRYLATAEAIAAPGSGLGVVVTALEANGVPAPLLVTSGMAVGLVVGLAAVIAAVWQLAPARVERRSTAD